MILEDDIERVVRRERADGRAGSGGRAACHLEVTSPSGSSALKSVAALHWRGRMAGGGASREPPVSWGLGSRWRIRRTKDWNPSSVYRAGGTTSMRKDQSTQMNEVSQLQHAWYHYANVIIHRSMTQSVRSLRSQELLILAPIDVVQMLRSMVTVWKSTLSSSHYVKGWHRARQASLKCDV